MAYITSDMDETYKQETISAWLRCSITETCNRKRILAGTTAIGPGINPQHVTLVVHCSNTFDLITYVQESGVQAVVEHLHQQCCLPSRTHRCRSTWRNRPAASRHLCLH